MFTREEDIDAHALRARGWTISRDRRDPPGAAQAFCIRRDTFDYLGNHLTKEIVHGVTSLTADHADPETIARLIRRHWAIENKIHWVRAPPGGKMTSTPTPAQVPRSWPHYET